MKRSPIVNIRRRTGRRPKSKDEVLGANIIVCMTTAMEAAVLHEATLKGETRPEAVRSLIQDGLHARAARRLGESENLIGAKWPPSSFVSATDTPVAKRGS